MPIRVVVAANAEDMNRQLSELNVMSVWQAGVNPLGPFWAYVTIAESAPTDQEWLG